MMTRNKLTHGKLSRGKAFRMTTKTVAASLALVAVLTTAKFARTKPGLPDPPVRNRTENSAQTPYVGGPQLRFASSPTSESYPDRQAGPGTLASRSLHSRVGIQAFGCGMIPRTGAGVAVGNRLVLTDAHVVAGSTAIELSIDGITTMGVLMHLDPNLDLALVEVNRQVSWSDDQRVTFGRAVKGDQGWVTLLRNEQLIPTPVRILRPVNITTEDIYVNGSVTRAGYEIKGSTRPGDSGAAVLVHGKIVGLLWSRSQLSKERAWLTDTSSIAGLIAGPQRWNIPKDTRCR
jgi:Trypsin-like peptidase domain